MLRDKQALMDISTAIQQTLLYAQDINRNNLQEDDEKQAAILYRLIVIGEATKRLSNEFREQHPTIPWRQMAGLRDVVIHDYDELDFDILWNVIHINLPDILPEIQSILEKPG
ncbi:MAG: HepT-like ribonuclease domain-containing protein [Microcoleaceae cyanobacterium]